MTDPTHKSTPDLFDEMEPMDDALLEAIDMIDATASSGSTNLISAPPQSFPRASGSSSRFLGELAMFE
jgi:hypothetical protein